MINMKKLIWHQTNNQILGAALPLVFTIFALSGCHLQKHPDSDPFPQRIRVLKKLPEGLACHTKLKMTDSNSGYGCGINPQQGKSGSYTQALKLLKQQAYRAKANTILIHEVLTPASLPGCQRQQVQIFADLLQCRAVYGPTANG